MKTAKTLMRFINSLDSEEIVVLKNEYGLIWSGRARFIFGSLKTEVLTSIPHKWEKVDGFYTFWI